jgi:hypothetical protein
MTDAFERTWQEDGTGKAGRQPSGKKVILVNVSKL